MALRDQPYLPLYIQDFLTDEKLNECSASATGVYIKIMCLMHKSEEYGKILLKQKDKQASEQILEQKDKHLVFFSLKLARLLPYTFDIIYAALVELIDEGVLLVGDDALVQKRMVKDNDTSVKRSLSGKNGGEETQKRIKERKNFAKAKSEANSEYENEYENEDSNTLHNQSLNNDEKSKKNGTEQINDNNSQRKDFWAERAKKGFSQT
jgi:hypothetical protein